MVALGVGTYSGLHNILHGKNFYVVSTMQNDVMFQKSATFCMVTFCMAKNFYVTSVSHHQQAAAAIKTNLDYVLSCSTSYIQTPETSVLLRP